jgi:hypothetical protein
VEEVVVFASARVGVVVATVTVLAGIGAFAGSASGVGDVQSLGGLGAGFSVVTPRPGTLTITQVRITALKASARSPRIVAANAKELPTGKERRKATLLGYAVVRPQKTSTKSRSDGAAADGTRAVAAGGALPNVFAETTVYGSIKSSVTWTDPDLDLQVAGSSTGWEVDEKVTSATILSNGKVTNPRALKQICRLNGALGEKDWIPLAPWSRSIAGTQPTASLSSVYKLACAGKSGLAVLAGILSGRGTPPPASGLINRLDVWHSTIENMNGVDQAVLCVNLVIARKATFALGYTLPGGTNPFTTQKGVAPGGIVNARVNVPVDTPAQPINVELRVVLGGYTESRAKKVLVSPDSVSAKCPFRL